MPFTVPEGYFEQMHSELMSAIGNEPVNIAKPRRNYRLLSGIAASVCLALIGGGVAFHHTFHNSADDAFDIQTEVLADADGVQPDDYIMMDNSDIYFYLSEE